MNYTETAFTKFAEYLENSCDSSYHYCHQCETLSKIIKRIIKEEKFDPSWMGF